MFIFILLLSLFTITESFQNVFALTPVADLTGQWSGFAQVSFTDTPCATSGNVNGYFTQNENSLSGSFSFVPTNAGSDDGVCSYEPWDLFVEGTLDGSRITLSSEGITFSGWYASSGIKLDFVADWLTGTTQLSPTGFTPSAFEPEPTLPLPEDEPTQPCPPGQYDGGDGYCYYEDEPTQPEDWAEEPLEDWAESNIETKKETTPKFIEPPSPSVFEINEETKPLFKALWDGKCDILSQQWQLLSAQSGSLPIVCTGGNIFLPSGEMVQFSAGDDWELKLIDWGVEGLFAKYVYVGLPKEVRDFIRLSRDVNKMTGEMIEGPKSIYDRIESMKALHLLVSKGEGELVGGVIKFQISCPTGECKFMKLEEESDGLKLYDVQSVFDKLTKTLGVTLNHNSVYILIELTPETESKSTDVETVSEQTITDTSSNEKSKNGGCLIATATFGSELAPQVQQLRELRDNRLLQTESGKSFMSSFNDLYYSFSPTIADYERENPLFKEAVKIMITPMISSLSILNYVDMDSEVSVLGYGISLILLNMGMYFVAPVIVIHTIRKKF